MKTRIFSILFALLLVLSSSLVMALPAGAFIGISEVWVDDDYTPSGYNDGHTWGYDAFDKIQDGINAVAGSTVHVAAGTYYEHITLVDGVDVLGAGASVTTIDGTSNGAVVTANSVGSGTTLDGFTITNGSATNGGGMYNWYSSPGISNCTFDDNSASSFGGGMYNGGYSYPEVTNCIFSDNFAAQGGGMANNSSSPTVTNCTFYGNGAVQGCGGMYNDNDSSSVVTNCILWDTGSEIGNNSSSPVVSYCDVEGGYTGTGNINSDPLFAGAGNYHLTSGSPCINTGDNSAPSLPSTDFESDPRILHSVVDMGADEYRQVYYVSTGGANGNDGLSWGTAWRDIVYALGRVVYGDIIYVGDGTFNEHITLVDGVEVLGGTIGTSTIDGTDTGRVVTANSVGSRTKLDGFTITHGNAYTGGGMYNNNSSPTVSNCTFSYNTATYGGGIYNVTSSLLTVTNCTFDYNTAAYYGGGIANWVSSATVTGCTFTNNSVNNDYDYTRGGGMCNYHCSSPVTVTGCTFTTNSATSSDYSGCGGGMYNEISSPTVTGCTFSTNSAASSTSSGYGGGMYNSESDPSVTGCTFSGNSATDSGGGMYNTESDPTVTGCTFTGNTTDWYGGGMYNLSSSSPTVTDCTFATNQADYGGGMANDTSSPTVTDCTFSGNTADYCGGGIYNSYYALTKVTNCIFSGNSADYNGGGMYNSNWAAPIVANCTFYNNSATTSGDGTHNDYYTTPTIVNCILWDGGDEIYTDNDAVPVVSYCDVEGGYTGTGNINADPLFAGAGDYHIQGNSPCVDAGNNDAVPAGITTDFEGEPRFLNGDGDSIATVDMGADECLAQVWVDDNWQSGPLPYAEDTDGDADFATITAAVDAVVSGGTVNVYPGTYSEKNIVINKSLTVESVSGDWHDTIVDPAGEVFRITDTLTGNVTISGFTITFAVYGIYIDCLQDGSTVTVNNCFIHHNSTGIYGSGDLNGDIFIDECIIAQNGGGATGIFFSEVAGTVGITDSVIGAYYDAETSTSYSGNGGDGIGISSIAATGSVLIDNNIIAGNTANGINDQISGCHGQLTITNNVIGAYYDTETSTPYVGNGSDGIRIDFIAETGNVLIDNNVIAGNTANGINDIITGGCDGQLTITNNIIGAYYDTETSRSYAGNGGDGIQIDRIAETGNVLINNNIIAANGSSGINDSFMGGCYGQLTITNNIIGAYDYDLTSDDGYCSGNDSFGITVEYVGTTGVVNIEGNKIADNYFGIEFGSGQPIDGDVTINNNYIGAWTDDTTVGEVLYTRTYPGNREKGIYVLTVAEDGSLIIINNKIAENALSIPDDTGIYIANIYGDTIISANYVGAWTQYILSDPVTSVTHLGNGGPGILIENVISGSLLIHGNTIAGNISEESGIHINLAFEAADVSVNLNDIISNDGYGFYYNYAGDTSLEYIDALNNWWGDTSGPGGEGTGTGDEVSTNVDYDPWLEVSVENALAGTITNGTLDNTDGADTEVIVTGSATVTSASYSGDPSGTGFSGDIGKYIDVHIDDDTDVTEIEIRLYYTNADISGLVESSLTLNWWDGTDWVACSDSGVDTADIPGPPAYSGYIWAKIRSDTTPNLNALTGSVFGGGGALVPPPVWEGDTTAPRISNVLTCYDGVTDATADICWITNEKSSSQVKFWASPSQLSPLDKTLVTEHHVQLTDLTPDTTYYYQTLSRDAAGNLAISDVYSFTTLGRVVPSAVFTSSDLSISPSEVSIGETVTITVLVTNTGNLAGSYELSLKVNGAVATEELTLDVNASESVSFTVTEEAAGSYNVEIDGLSGSFTVTEPVSSQPPASEDESPAAGSTANWPLIGGIIAGVVVVGLIVFFVVRRARGYVYLWIR